MTLCVEDGSFTGTERHRTDGLKLSRLSPELARRARFGRRKTFLGLLPFVNRREGQKASGLAFDPNLYTPTDIEMANPDRRDLPFTGRSCFELDFITGTDATDDAFALKIGIAGPHGGLFSVPDRAGITPRRPWAKTPFPVPVRSRRSAARRGATTPPAARPARTTRRRAKRSSTPRP